MTMNHKKLLTLCIATLFFLISIFTLAQNACNPSDSEYKIIFDPNNWMLDRSDEENLSNLSLSSKLASSSNFLEPWDIRRFSLIDDSEEIKSNFHYVTLQSEFISDVEFPYYELNIKINPEGKSYSCHTLVKVKSHIDNVSNIIFLLDYKGLSYVKENGKDANFKVSSTGIITVTLDTPLNAEDEITVEMENSATEITLSPQGTGGK